MSRKRRIMRSRSRKRRTIRSRIIRRRRSRRVWPLETGGRNRAKDYRLTITTV